MRRMLVPAIFLMGASAAPALGLVAAPPAPAQMAVSAQVVVAAKVVSAEEKLAEVLAPYPGAKDKQNYKIAVVKVETGLIGADKLKEIKVGVFQPPAPKPGAPKLGRGPAAAYELKEGQQLLLFLNKHPHADFYIPASWGAPPDLSTDAGKKALDEVSKTAKILSDPMKALKADKPEARAEAATIMVMKYRAGVAFGGPTEQVAIDADESKLILKALAEGEWKQEVRFGGPPNPLTASYQLNLTKADGWVEPVIAPSPPGVPQPDFAGIRKDAFVKWLAGPGKDYRIKKVVPKTVAEK